MKPYYDVLPLNLSRSRMARLNGQSPAKNEFLGKMAAIKHTNLREFCWADLGAELIFGPINTPDACRFAI